MRLVKLILRILRYTIYAALAFVIAALAVLTLTERGRENLAGLISDFASSSGRTVKIAGINGIWSGNLTLQSLVIEDEDGPWLVGRNIAVDWSPLALITKTFQADRVFAERIEVARRPKPANAPKEEAGSFSLPFSIDVKAIDLPDIALGPALAGGVASVAAKGSAQADTSPLKIVSQLGIARSDGRAGNIDAAIDFAPRYNRLDIDIRASEPQGGIIANLLKLPGAPPVEINVSGSGPAADWSGSGTFAVDGTVVTSVEGRHQLTSQGSAIEVKGTGNFERFMPEDLRPLLSGNSSFDLAGTLTGAGGVAIERATIESSAITGTASGTLDPAGASDFALQINAAGEGVPLSFGTEDAPIDMVVNSASVRAIGDGREPNLDIAASLSRVTTNDAELDNLAIALHSDAFNIQNRSGPVTGTAAAAALIIDNPTIAPLVAGKISAGIAGTLTTNSLTVTDGNLGSDALSGKFTGDVSLVDGSVTLKINADVASSALPASVRPVLAERVEMTADISRDHEGMVSADPFEISSGELSASGRVRAANQEIDADIAGTARQCRPACSGRDWSGGPRSDGDGRAGQAGCVADGDQRPDPGGGARDRRTKARRDRQGGRRQSCCRCHSIRHARRPVAGRRGVAVDGFGQARDQWVVADARPKPRLRRPRSRSEFPALGHARLRLRRHRSSCCIGEPGCPGRHKRHDPFCRGGRHA